MAFEIENVAVEVGSRGAASKYAQLNDLQVGQSFIVPFNKPGKNADGTAQTKDETQLAQLGALRGVAQQYQAKYAKATGEHKVNRKGIEVDIKEPTRRFGVVADKSGFRIGRTA